MRTTLSIAAFAAATQALHIGSPHKMFTQVGTELQDDDGNCCCQYMPCMPTCSDPCDEESAESEVEVFEDVEVTEVPIEETDITPEDLEDATVIEVTNDEGETAEVIIIPEPVEPEEPEVEIVVTPEEPVEVEEPVVEPEPVPEPEPVEPEPLPVVTDDEPEPIPEPIPEPPVVELPEPEIEVEVEEPVVEVEVEVEEPVVEVEVEEPELPIMLDEPEMEEEEEEAEVEETGELPIMLDIPVEEEVVEEEPEPISDPVEEGDDADGTAGGDGNGGSGTGGSTTEKEEVVVYETTVEELPHDTADPLADILAEADGRPVILDFQYDGCPPCQDIAPAFEQLKDSNPDALFRKVDVMEHMQML